MTEQVWITLITALSGLLVASVTAYFTYRQNQQIFELKDRIEHQLERIKALEDERDTNRRTINGLRSWGYRLLAWLQAQGLKGYPEPEPGLLDTDPNIPKVGK